MKHLQFNNYPQQLHYVCHEKKGDVYLYAVLEQRKMYKLLDMFYQELEEHGYDVISPNDGFTFELAQREMNEAIKRQAIKNGSSSCEELTIEDEICRCGKWLFLKRLPYLSERKDIELKEKGRGGAREGAGRKRQYGRLSYSSSSVIRVPSSTKDGIKELIDWLIEQEAKGIDVRSAIWSGLYSLKDSAEESEKLNALDLANKMKAEVEVLKELFTKIPKFSIKDEAEI